MVYCKDWPIKTDEPFHFSCPFSKYFSLLIPIFVLSWREKNKKSYAYISSCLYLHEFLGFTVNPIIFSIKGIVIAIMMRIVRTLFSECLFNWRYPRIWLDLSIMSFVSYHLLTQIFLGPPSCINFLDFVLCFCWGKQKKQTIPIFFFWSGIRKYFVLPILLKRVAILRGLHLVCGLKFVNRLKERGRLKCTVLISETAKSACLGMGRLTAHGEERIPLIPIGWLCVKHYCASNSNIFKKRICVCVSVLDSIWNSVFSS